MLQELITIREEWRLSSKRKNEIIDELKKPKVAASILARGYFPCCLTPGCKLSCEATANGKHHCKECNKTAYRLCSCGNLVCLTNYKQHLISNAHDADKMSAFKKALEEEINHKLSHNKSTKAAPPPVQAIRPTQKRSLERPEDNWALYKKPIPVEPGSWSLYNSNVQQNSTPLLPSLPPPQLVPFNENSFFSPTPKNNLTTLMAPPNIENNNQKTKGTTFFGAWDTTGESKTKNLDTNQFTPP